jgi:hypothetical protein
MHKHTPTHLRTCTNTHLHTTTQSELSFEDIDKVLPDDVAHILEWLTEKVDALSTKLKAEPKDAEEVCVCASV